MRFTDIQAEVLIAGAGPAGASTSLFLSKHKIHHIILDKAVFPRDKICGDALSGKVVHVLNKLDPSYIPELESKKEFVNWILHMRLFWKIPLSWIWIILHPV